MRFILRLPCLFAIALIGGCTQTTSPSDRPPVFETLQATLHSSVTEFNPGDTVTVYLRYRTRHSGVGQARLTGSGFDKGTRITMLDSPHVIWTNPVQGDFARHIQIDAGERTDTFQTILHDRSMYRFSAAVWFDSLLAPAGDRMISVRSAEAEMYWVDPSGYGITTGPELLHLLPR